VHNTPTSLRMKRQKGEEGVGLGWIGGRGQRELWGSLVLEKVLL